MITVEIMTTKGSKLPIIIPLVSRTVTKRFPIEQCNKNIGIEYLEPKLTIAFGISKSAQRSPVKNTPTDKKTVPI